MLKCVPVTSKHIFVEFMWSWSVVLGSLDLSVMNASSHFTQETNTDLKPVRYTSACTKRMIQKGILGLFLWSGFFLELCTTTMAKSCQFSFFTFSFLLNFCKSLVMLMFFQQVGTFVQTSHCENQTQHTVDQIHDLNHCIRKKSNCH